MNISSNKQACLVFLVWNLHVFLKEYQHIYISWQKLRSLDIYNIPCCQKNPKSLSLATEVPGM